MLTVFKHCILAIYFTCSMSNSSVCFDLLPEPSCQHCTKTIKRQQQLPCSNTHRTVVVNFQVQCV